MPAVPLPTSSLAPAVRALLACPRCRGNLSGSERLSCAACKVVFPIRDGIPRMNDGAPERDARLAAEWTAQSHAHRLYVDQAAIMNHWEEEVLPGILDEVGEVAEVRGPILDAGCGVGHLGNVVENQRRAVELVGLDFQGELLAEAGRGYAGLIEGDIHHLPIRDGAFAAVVASNSLHHFPDIAAAMREIGRVLAPGGTFVAYDPRHVAPLETVKKLLRRHDAAFAEDHKAFRLDEYREVLGSSGLDVIDVRTVDPVGPLLATGLDYLKIGRLGIARHTARAVASADRWLGGRSRTNRLGLMLVGRAVKRSR